MYKDLIKIGLLSGCVLAICGLDEDCGYILSNHHNALADAEACAEIAMHLL